MQAIISAIAGSACGPHIALSLSRHATHHHHHSIFALRTATCVHDVSVLEANVMSQECKTRMHQYRVSLAALTALAIASAANRPAPPVISITTPQDDFFDPDTRSFLQDWESRYSNRVSAVSQAEFFAPKELLTDEDASTSSDARFEDDDVPLHPSAPRIVISRYDLSSTFIFGRKFDITCQQENSISQRSRRAIASHTQIASAETQHYQSCTRT
jgi:hypothetical protein